MPLQMKLPKLIYSHEYNRFVQWLWPKRKIYSHVRNQFHKSQVQAAEVLEARIQAMPLVNRTKAIN